jgi:hypothetical protein
MNVLLLTLVLAAPQCPPPPQAPPVKEWPKPAAVSQCKCAGKGQDACKCPGKECIECGCQCGKQRQWTACNRPCSCGCQDEDYPEYCDCGERSQSKAVESTPLYSGPTYRQVFQPAASYYQPMTAWQAPAVPVSMAAAENDRWRPRPQPIQRPRPVQQPRPVSQPYCPPGGT